MALTKTAAVVWAGGMNFDATAGSGFDLRLGSSKEYPGWSPMEMVLVGLAGCTAMDVITILEKKRQDVTHFEVRVVGTRAEEHPKVYTDLQVEFVVEGHGVDAEAVERAIELSQDKYCSVSAMLQKAAPVRTSYRVLEASPQLAALEPA